MRVCTGWFPGLILLVASEAGAQVTADDYRRAEQFLSWNAVRLVKNAEVRPRWIGGTDRFWYRRELGDGKEFILVDARSGRKAPAFDHVRLARLVTYRLDQRRVRQMHLLQMVPKEGYAAVHYSYRYPLPGDTAVALAHLLVIDVTDRTVTPVQGPAIEVPFITPLARRFLWWAEDGKAFYFLRVGRGQKSLTLEAADPATGATRTLLREQASTSFVEPNLMLGMEPNVRVRSASREVIWFSERDGYAQLYLYDDAGNLKNRITQPPLVVRDLVRVDPKTRRVYFLAGGREPGDPYYRKLYSVGLDGTGLKLLTPEDADHSVTLSPTGDFFVDTYSRMDTIPVSRLRRADGRDVMELERADLSKLLAAGFRFPERFSAKAADGVTDIHGLIFRPGNFDPAKKYPVLDDIYPGPQIIRTPKAFSGTVLDPAAIAELGFIVVLVDGRGTPFRSKAFHDLSYGKLEQAGTLEDHIAALRQLAARDPSFDLSRVGVYGHSGGGFAATRAILAHPDFYKVAVASAGNHDQRGYIALWGELYQGYPVSDAWTAQANVGLADRLQGKLLLMTGDLDDNVHPALTMQVVDALVKANKDFDLIILPNRNHGSAGDPYFIRRRWDYFVQHLLGATPPANYRIRPPGAAR